MYLSRSEARFIKFLGKKYIYLMHGSYFMETGLHHRTEPIVHRYATKIVSVSRVHAQMIKDEFPQYAHKVVEWCNGIDWEEIENIKKTVDVSRRDPKKIILFGGGRHMKGNLAVCRAVQALNEGKNLGLHVDVYGELLDDDFSREISRIPCVNYKPLIPKALVNAELAKSNLFIANSLFDTFNLALMEAIGLGCNVLFSQNVGAKDVIPGKTDSDIIFDVNDIDEIKSKIEHVLENPNNRRLYDSVDREATSWRARAAELAAIMENL